MHQNGALTISQERARIKNATPLDTGESMTRATKERIVVLLLLREHNKVCLKQWQTRVPRHHKGICRIPTAIHPTLGSVQCEREPSFVGTERKSKGGRGRGKEKSVLLLSAPRLSVKPRLRRSLQRARFEQDGVHDVQQHRHQSTPVTCWRGGFVIPK